MPLKVTLADCLTRFLRNLPAELAHDFAIWGLQRNLVQTFIEPKLLQGEIISGLSLKIPGIGSLKHPIGLAAGFDKNAKCIQALSHLGFSMIEVGTITPKAQSGNPKPRLFRVPDAMGLINRMGFNNEGMEACAQRLETLNWQNDRCPIGINSGKNKLTSESHAVDDYVAVLTKCKNLGQYFVVNVSSPNTSGLRQLATPSFLGLVIEAVPDLKSRLFVKLDPDMDRQQLQTIICYLAEQGVQGVILTNTHKVQWPQSGGLSGHSLSATTMSRLEWAHQVHKGSLTMLAAGGIMTGQDVYQALIRGAAAVQIYTAMIYRGPYVVWKMLLELQSELQLRGVTHLEDVVGSYYS